MVIITPPKARAKNAAARKREKLREQIWPGSEKDLWSRKTNDGWTTVPRLLPLVMHLIKALCKKGNPSLVYLELWTRAFDEGIVTINNEDASAYASGYTGSRAVRTWREHVFKLVDLGFIRVAPQGNREIAHVLLLNPLSVCADLHHKKKISQAWWAAFVHQAQEIGANLTSGEGLSEE